MIGRIVRSADFERVLGAPSRARTVHFAVHHLAANPSAPKKPVKSADKNADKPVDAAELSTADTSPVLPAVDDSPQKAISAAPSGLWLGTVVPKRHARRSVTRSLLKRHIHAAFALAAAAGQESPLPAGLWVVRLRAPFDKKLFPSAASDALRVAAREELAQLVARLFRPAASGSTPRR